MINGETRKTDENSNPLNQFERAVSLLKSAGSFDHPETAERTADKNRSRDTESVLKEARVIVKSCLKQNAPVQANPERQKKRAAMERRILFNTVLNVSLAASVLVLLFLIISILW